MKINEAYKTLEDLLANSDKKAKQRIYKQLLGALSNLKERDLSGENLRSVEGYLEQLRLNQANETSARELRSRRNLFMKEVMETLSLVSEGHYLTMGMGLGVAFGSALGSVILVFVGIPEGASGTGIGIGIGITVGCIVASYLDIEARKQNRVLITQTT